MKLRITSRAFRDIDNILSYIQHRNPTAATAIAARIDRTLNLIREMPLIRRKSTRRGLRERPVPRTPILIIYAVSHDRIEIVSVFHTFRDPRGK